MSLSPWMYVVLLGLVCLVYAQMLPRKEKAAPAGEMMKELEQSMELFASDMEEQNEAFLQLFSETKRDYEGHLAKLSGRLEQLEKQNQHLVQELSRPRAVQQPHIVLPAISDSQLVSSVTTMDAFPTSGAVEAAAIQASSAAQSPVQADTEPERPSREPLLMNVKERYAELFQLYGQSKSVEYIAKKLNMNKGEVQLIIQLAKQEERAHV